MDEQFPQGLEGSMDEWERHGKLPGANTPSLNYITLPKEKSKVAPTETVKQEETKPEGGRYLKNLQNASALDADSKVFRLNCRLTFTMNSTYHSRSHT